jgi:hypothetical protein
VGIKVWTRDVPVVEVDGMCGCRQGAVDDLEQAGFAGAVAAEEAGDGTCANPEVDRIRSKVRVENQRKAGGRPRFR